MRLEIELEDELVRQLDLVIGRRSRSEFIAEAVRRSMARADRDRRWTAINRAAGSISDQGHEWDEDLAAWVHDSRRGDPKRVG